MGGASVILAFLAISGRTRSRLGPSAVFEISVRRGEPLADTDDYGSFTAVLLNLSMCHIFFRWG